MLEIHTSASCNLCHKYVDYHKGNFLCPHCKNLMRISPDDIKFNLSDLYELNIPYTSNKFDNRLEKLRKLCDKYNIDFLGFDPFEQTKNNHDNYIGMLDIGWENGFPENLPKIIKELKQILR